MQPSSAQSAELNFSDFSVPSPNSTESDIDRWSVSSLPSSDKEDTAIGNEEGASKNSKFPMIVEDQRRCIEVYLSPHSEKFQGLEVLKLSTKEQRESRKDLAIKCLRNKVEELNKELVSKEHTLRKEKEEAVSRVRSFWRDNIIEGCSRSGRMARASLQH